MITPRFSCSQDVRSLTLSVYSSVVEDDESSAIYDPASGYLTLTLTKLNPGENFPDLDLLGKLLAPPAAHQSTPHRPTIEVLASQEANTERSEILQAAANDWSVPQTIPDTLPVLETSLYKPYGFLNAYTGYFIHVATTENEVNELGADAETLTPSERRVRRLKREDEKWDPEYYMADFADTEQIDQLLEWTHPHLDENAAHATITSFTEAENAAMLRLPRKECNIFFFPLSLTKRSYFTRRTRDIYLTLLTLLFAYAYDARTTQHDPTSESAWTIATLTPAFSALDPPPYHYSTSNSFDAASFLVRGTRTVLRCLLELRAILDAHQVYYVYSRIWLDDFCRWIQACASEDTLIKLGRAVSCLSIQKDSLGWDLVALEIMVQTVKEGQPDSDDEDLELERPAAL
ncbi:hypothetical protein BGW80DRAFT_1435864 [Lactifluus volemus]|nr:hypothetical protein BGW80DRAFT_1435864 [Lactifluus volemus]